MISCFSKNTKVNFIRKNVNPKKGGRKAAYKDLRELKYLWLGFIKTRRENDEI